MDYKGKNHVVTGAIVALTSAVVLNLAPYHIQVNAVAPEFIYTGMTAKSFDDPLALLQSEKRIPCGLNFVST